MKEWGSTHPSPCAGGAHCGGISQALYKLGAIGWQMPHSAATQYVPKRRGRRNPSEQVERLSCSVFARAADPRHSARQHPELLGDGMAHRVRGAASLDIESWQPQPGTVGRDCLARKLNQHGKASSLLGIGHSDWSLYSVYLLYLLYLLYSDTQVGSVLICTPCTLCIHCTFCICVLHGTYRTRSTYPDLQSPLCELVGSTVVFNYPAMGSTAVSVT